MKYIKKAPQFNGNHLRYTLSHIFVFCIVAVNNEIGKGDPVGNSKDRHCQDAEEKRRAVNRLLFMVQPPER